MVKIFCMIGLISLQIGEVSEAITKTDKWGIVAVLVGILFYFGWRDYTKDQKISMLLDKVSARDEGFAKLMSEFSSSLQGLNTTMGQVMRSVDELYDKNDKIYERLLQKL